MALLCAGMGLPLAQAAEDSPGRGAGYVARQDGLRSVFDAIASKLKKPVILSARAARKQVSGEFDLGNPQALLEKLTLQLGLIWYGDSQSIYVYDAGEMRNSVVLLRNVPLATLNDFLRKSGLYDKRYPLRGDNRSGTFYLSGPPVYVDLVSNAASFMDQQSEGMDLGRQKIGVIRLNNTFVGDRSYEMRDQKIVIPGMATVIEKLLQGESKPVAAAEAAPAKPAADALANLPMPAGLPPLPLPGDAKPKANPAAEATDPFAHVAAASDIKVIAYPDTNSLLVKGTAEQVRFIERLVAALDVAKRHVELSLWIIDMEKDDLDQLGVDWRGQVSLGGRLGMTFNSAGSFSTLDGTRFLASVMALSQKNKANVVSRPVLLTQENVPAIFDNNRTFYTKLEGERSVDLQHVTYGTLVSVLPRFSADGQIEMALNIEDGREARPPDYSQGNKDAATPEVGRTRISTVARMPQGKSLLIGGFTRDSSSDDQARIPLLGDAPILGKLFRYRHQNLTNTVRVFLIQPREITEPLKPDAAEMTAGLASQSGLDVDPLQQKVRDYLERRGSWTGGH
ncbi:type III secretion system outer membrane ring subunit SctC [Chromobacterium sp. IIBBL 290-4]|uniref:type III secretion system outer membrane ring subunit SctC n=1 Tax=Chromobacterium sp. IIBBL 290-4 TaxID=2953890 RepID=UPI00273A6886|nr:type III secretion system outer membrane ring subunit SctC [Chromobacterium sp. IIBBL 290-4]